MFRFNFIHGFKCKVTKLMKIKLKLETTGTIFFEATAKILRSISVLGLPSLSVCRLNSFYAIILVLVD
jgi:hypothetical protein